MTLYHFFSFCLSWCELSIKCSEMLDEVGSHLIKLQYFIFSIVISLFVLTSHITPRFVICECPYKEWDYLLVYVHIVSSVLFTAVFYPILLFIYKFCSIISLFNLHNQRQITIVVEMWINWMWTRKCCKAAKKHTTIFNCYNTMIYHTKNLQLR